MMIDVHGHIGRFGTQYSTAEALNAWAAERGIDCVLVSNAAAAGPPGPGEDREEIDANLACLEACRQFARLRPLYWVRPSRRDSNVHALAGALACEPFAGAVFSPVANEFSADAKLLDPYLAVLQRMDLPAFFHSARDERASPERIYTLARRHESARIVLYDALGDVHRDDAIRVAQRCTQRGAARVLLDTANADLATVLTAIEKAGPACVVYGSDACLWHALPGRERENTELRALRAALSAGAFERVAAGNASALLNPRAASVGAAE